MPAEKLLQDFCRAVEQRDGKSFAALFTEDGIYHDVFYGAFTGREKIAQMIDDWFYRTAKDFRWVMHDPVSDGKRSMHGTRSATRQRCRKPTARGRCSRALRS